MTDLWTYLFEASIVNVFGNPFLLGLILLAFITLILFITGANKIFILPLMLIFSYGLVQFGLIPTALFGGLLIIVGLIFALTILNTIFGQ